MRIDHTDNSRMRAAYAAVLILALLLRLAFLWPGVADPQRAFANEDARGYWALANNLLHHGVWSQDAISPGVTPARDIVRTPVYPAFLAGAIAIGGRLAGLLAQAVMDVGTCILIVWFGRRILSLSPGLALLAGLLYALDLGCASFAAQFMSETLFTFLTLAALAVFLGPWPPRQTWPTVSRWAVAAMLLTAATLTRPISLYLPAVLFALAGGWWIRQRGREGRATGVSTVPEGQTPLSPAVQMPVPRCDAGRRAMAAALAAILYIAPVAAWVFANGAATGVATISSVTKYGWLHYGTAVDCHARGIYDEFEIRRVLFERLDRIRGDRPALGDQLDEMAREGKGLLWGNARTAAGDYVKGVGRSLYALPTETLGVLGYSEREVLPLGQALRTRPCPAGQVAMRVGYAAFALVIAGVALAGAVLSRRFWSFPAVVLAATIAYLLCISAYTGGGRFRCVAMPELCLLAAWAIHARRRRHPEKLS